MLKADGQEFFVAIQTLLKHRFESRRRVLRKNSVHLSCSSRRFVHQILELRCRVLKTTHCSPPGRVPPLPRLSFRVLVRRSSRAVHDESESGRVARTDAFSSTAG